MRSPVQLDVIVPVHNGEAELPRMLDALAAEVWSGVRVSLVLNACRDSSEVVARAGLARLAAAGAETRLFSSERASRAAALTLGERDVRGHRVYLDQDAVVSPGALRALLQALDSGVHFASGMAEWRTSSRLVASAMRAWNHAPYVIEQTVTAGMYAVSAAGRARWVDWPEGLPDDKFARLHFDMAERIRLRGVTYGVAAPESMQGLTAARRRYFRSNLALQTECPALAGRDGRKLDGLWRVHPELWPGILLLSVAELAARVRSA